MRSITHCPACQTQFFVTEEQLNKHHGQVRCGHCMHVFDAKEQLVALDTPPENNAAPVDEAIVDEPLVNDNLLNDDLLNKDVLNKDSSNTAPMPIVEDVESAATIIVDTAVAETTEITNAADYDHSTHDDTASHDTASGATPDETVEITNAVIVLNDQPYNFEDATDQYNLSPHHAVKKTRSWPMLLITMILLLLAMAQSIYFLRNEIAIYYPNAKPYLVQACQQIACSIDLPKQIEFIVIDDSDIQEDANYAGLMRLSSTLINQAGFNQAYPNVELTLTDVEDKPILRRLFKPSEYLPAHANIANGLAAGEEVRIKLAMTTQGVTVAGYRVFVTY